MGGKSKQSRKQARPMARGVARGGGSQMIESATRVSRIAKFRSKILAGKGAMER